MSQGEKTEPERRPANDSLIIGDRNAVQQNQIIGDNNVVNQTIDQSIEVPAESEDDLTIRFGKWFMLKVFGTLKHSMKPFGVIVAVSGIGTLYSLLNPFYLIQRFGDSNYIWIVGGLLLALTGVGFGWLVFMDSSTTTCPKCGWKFSWLNTKRVLKHHVTLSNQELRKYENTFQCTNPSCKYKEENVPQTVRVPFSSV